MQNDTSGISRREFLKEAGFLIGGAALVSASTAVSCAPNPSSTSGVTDMPPTTVPMPPPSVTLSETVILHVNQREYQLAVNPGWTLDFVLREQLGLFGTKIGCGRGDCASCTILTNGIPVLACLMLAVECEGLEIETIEGASRGLALSPLQQRFCEREAFQCGFCTPGFIMAAQGLLNVNPRPSLDEVREALAGHICTCGNLARVIQAVAGGL